MVAILSVIGTVLSVACIGIDWYYSTCPYEGTREEDGTR